MLLTRAVTDEATLDAVARQIKRRANPALKRYTRSLVADFLQHSDLAAGRPASRITPSGDAAQAWVRDGLVEGTARVTLAAINRVDALTRPLLSQAIDAGRWPKGAGVAESVVASIIGRPYRAGRALNFGSRIAQEILDWIERSVLGRLLAGQRALDEWLHEALSIVVRKGPAILTPEQMEEAVQLVGERFGTKGFEAADATTTFYDSHVVSEQFEATVGAGFKATAPIWPYLEYRTQLDGRVRESHLALEGFVAQSTWGGWPTVQPPNGWNCRCRLIPVSWQEAEARDWAGLFPVGESQLDEFMLLGGSEGFDKGAFTSLGLLVN